MVVRKGSKSIIRKIHGQITGITAQEIQAQTEKSAYLISSYKLVFSEFTISNIQEFSFPITLL